jgi:hypothetical protein
MLIPTIHGGTPPIAGIIADIFNWFLCLYSPRATGTESVIAIHFRTGPNLRPPMAVALQRIVSHL